MYNWSVDLSRMKNDPLKYEKYVLEQKINFGLDGEKLSVKLLKKHWKSLKIDEFKRRYLKKIVWPE
jgi:hypothetical protein